jgi:7,8-dihydropterin-6-yl-methyl-4-(beta-D-ribofuranosyl)aminobenzene 5'-phosphate synthase
MRNLFLHICLCIVSYVSYSQQTTVSNIDFNEGKATVIFDAFGKDTSLQKGWGYAVLISYNGKNILFDGGSNADIFKYNLTRKGIDPSKIDIVIVSHSHYDHVNGIDYILKINPDVKIYFPFDPFWGANNLFDARGQDSLVKDSLPAELRYFDGKSDVFTIPQAGGRFWNANIEHIKESKEIMPGIN